MWKRKGYNAPTDQSVHSCKGVKSAMQKQFSVEKKVASAYRQVFYYVSYVAFVCIFKLTTTYVLLSMLKGFDLPQKGFNPSHY